MSDRTDDMEDLDICAWDLIPDSLIYQHALRARVTDERVRSYVSTWPEALQDMFWSAVNAPVHSDSAFLTLAFATALAHELAEKIRAEFADAFDANQEVLSGTDALLAADFIDPEVTV